MAKPIPMSSDDCGHVLLLAPVEKILIFYGMRPKYSRILLGDIVCNVNSLLRSLFVILQHSDPYKRKGRMQLLHNFSPGGILT